MQRLRLTGIRSVGPAPVGTHFCAFSQDRNQIRELVVDYLRAGIEEGDACVWVVGSDADQQQARDTIVPDTRGAHELQLIPRDDLFPVPGRFDRELADAWWTRLLDKVDGQHAAVRLCVDMGTPDAVFGHVAAEYEAWMDTRIDDAPVLALCTYPMSSCTLDDTLCVSGHHPLTLTTRQGEWAVASDRRTRHLDNRRRARLGRALLWLRREAARAMGMGGDERSLLEVGCRAAVELGCCQRAWLGIPDGDQGTIRIAAMAGSGRLAPDITKSGPASRAIQTGGIVLMAGAPAVPSPANAHDARCSRPAESCAALPLRVESAVIGALVVHWAGTAAIDDGDLGQMRELADTLALGLASLRSRSDRERMRAQLLFAERLMGIGTLAASVAHEINNPLAYVLANLELAERALAGDARPGAIEHMRARLAQMRDGVERVRVIARDLKLLARSDDDAHPSADLGRVLEAAVSIVWNGLRHRARLVREFAAAPHVRGSEARLGQVFLNLLINAVQAIPEGQAERNEIRVTAKLVDDAAVVEISDTGMGIDPRHRERLFLPFFTTKPAGEGTGLGLSISKDIVNGLGGEITFESTVGCGTTFRVRLPLAPAAGETACPRIAAIVTPRSAGPRRRILVVDDEPLMGEVLCDALFDHEVRAETDGVRALQALQQGERFDVILCDIMMPAMSGAELYASITRIDSSQARRVVFMTGGAFTARARDFLAGVDNERIEKPFEIHALRALIDRLCA